VADDRVAVVACGAIAQPVAEIAARHGWPVDVHPLPPLLHNRPERIAGAVGLALDDLTERYRRVAVGYADCGSYGALDALCAERGVQRLPGAHCYDLLAGQDRMRRIFEEEPGTYVLTDFLVRSFARAVVAELGLDRFPQLREDYFGHYRRVVWLAQHPTPALQRQARSAAAALGLPLETFPVQERLLSEALARLVAR
jgi:hypothetical protein